MNKLLRIILFAVLAANPAVAAPESAPNSLTFRNGDLLYGELISIDPHEAVRWKHPDASTPIDFKPDTVAAIDFPSPTNSIPRGEHACRLLLANGDTLEGDLVSFENQKLVLQTWYAGRLTIPRSLLQLLVLEPQAPVIFDSITGLEGWTQASAAAGIPGETGHWSYRNGAFYASKPASIARGLNLPDVAEIRFDLAWRGNLNLAIALYTDSLQPILVTAKDQAPDFGAFYSLRLQDSFSFNVDLWPIKKAERLRPLGQLFIPSLNNKDKLHVDILVSKPQHRIMLLLDDAPVKDWVDPEGFAAEGKGMRFVQNSGTALKLSNLHITEWDGMFPEISGETTETTQDVVWSENRNKIAGTVETITREKLTVHTTNGPVTVPLAQVKTIDFAHRPEGSPPALPAMVRATFAQGGGVTFILERWRPNEMTVLSPDFGRAKINPAAFTRLEFLYPETNSATEPKG